MQCVRPIKASQAFDGTITFRRQNAIPGLIPFTLPCRKCLPCRLDIGRQKAIRAYHEAQMSPHNIFLTLTYDDDHLESPRLIKQHIIDFNKDLRNHLGNDPNHRIKIMYTGEYGEQTKRPHWHSIIFNYQPPDGKNKYTSHSGEPVKTSVTLTDLWNKGAVEYGTVTIDSASYVARYAAKKLVHGPDEEHDFHPIHQTPREGLGKSWIEKYWEQTFHRGYIVLPNGQQAAIPRYYSDWLKKHHPDAYVKFKTTVQLQTIRLAEEQARKEEFEFLSHVYSRPYGWPIPLYPHQVKKTILERKFKLLQEHLKL